YVTPLQTYRIDALIRGNSRTQRGLNGGLVPRRRSTKSQSDVAANEGGVIRRKAGLQMQDRFHAGVVDELPQRFERQCAAERWFGSFIDTRLKVRFLARDP